MGGEESHRVGNSSIQSLTFTQSIIMATPSACAHCFLNKGI